tara:strand:+ start:1242 stop:1595 length:354 start_codon:yes stop_codon:yes gene_type:complete
MAKDIIESAILLLRSRALEQYGIMKDLIKGPLKEQDTDRLAQHVVKLAQFENAMVTLQQYSPHLIESLLNAAPPTVVEAEEEKETPTGEPISINETNSPSFARSQQFRTPDQEKDES